MPKHLRTRLAALTLLSCLAHTAPLHAEEDSAPRVLFSGFGTLGLVHTQGDGASFSRDMGQVRGATNRGVFWETDSRIGLQATLAATENLQCTAQVISRYRAENNFAPELSLGFVKYTPTENIDLRAGRIGYDIFHAGDSREVGYSYLWVRPPVEYYAAMATPSIDGGDIVLHIPIASGVGRLKLYSGLARNKIPNLFAQTQWAGNITADLGVMEDLGGSRYTGGLIDYQGTNWTVRLSQSNMKILREIPPGPFDTLGFLHATADAQTDTALANTLNRLADDISFASKSLKFTSLGVIYENGPLRTDMAAYHLRSTSLLFGEVYAGYWMAGYRFGKFTPFVNIAAIKSRKSHRTDELRGKGVDAATSIADFMLSRADLNRQSLSLGVRYDWQSNIALKFQMDALRNRTCTPVSLPFGSTPPCAPPMLLPEVPVNWNGRANVYSAVLDFTF